MVEANSAAGSLSGKSEISQSVLGLAAIISLFTLLTVIIYQQGQLMESVRLLAQVSNDCGLFK